MLLHNAATIAAHPHVVVEAGVLRAIRNAVIAILLVAFLLGGVVGFWLGKAYGRRTRGSSDPGAARSHRGHRRRRADGGEQGYRPRWR